MLQNNQVVSMLRFCLSVDESVNAIGLLNKGNGQVLLGSYQGEEFTQEEIHSIQRINAIWNKIQLYVESRTLFPVSIFAEPKTLLALRD